MLRFAVPVLFTVTDLEAESVFTTTLPNDRLVALRETAGAEVLTPVPLKVTLCDGLDALSVMVIVALKVPVAVGANWT